jgi:hypothetical protein
MAKSCAQNVAIDGDGTGMGGRHEENDLGLKRHERKGERERRNERNKQTKTIAQPSTPVMNSSAKTEETNARSNQTRPKAVAQNLEKMRERRENVGKDAKHFFFIFFESREVYHPERTSSLYNKEPLFQKFPNWGWSATLVCVFRNAECLSTGELL